MIYVIGQSVNTYVTLKYNEFLLESPGEKDKFLREISEVIIDGPQNKATFFNNKADAEEALEEINKRISEIKFSDYLLLDDPDKTIPLKIITLTPTIEE